MNRPRAPSDDHEVRTLTAELARRLRGFVDGRETHDSLEAWAHAVWGRTQDGPIPTHAVATRILINLWNAAARTTSDHRSPYILRPVDAANYLHELQRGELRGNVDDFALLGPTLPELAARLDRDTERHVLDGVGWHEFLQFASPGTGRVFVLSRPLQHLIPAGATIAATERRGELPAILRDLCLSLDLGPADLVELDEHVAPAHAGR
jgi:hypothetical protein